MHRGVEPLDGTVRGTQSPGRPSELLGGFVAVLLAAGTVHADPTATIPDPPDRRQPPTIGSAGFRPTWDLDGIYLWLGPTGAASRIDAGWDSTFGGHAAVLRVAERAPLGVVGGMLGATMWTERDGGRVWLDAVAGTRIGGRMIGASLGPMVELSDLQHPRIGGAVGLWAFVGVTPFVRVGVVDEMGGFVEIGLHLALPVLRR